MKSFIMRLLQRWLLTLVLSHLKPDDVLAIVEDAERSKDNAMAKRGVVYRYIRDNQGASSPSKINLATELAVGLFKAVR